MEKNNNNKIIFFYEKKIVNHCGDFSGGSVVRNMPANTGDTGPIPGRGTKIPHAVKQLGLSATRRESVGLNKRSCKMQQRSWVLQLRPDTTK